MFNFFNKKVFLLTLSILLAVSLFSCNKIENSKKNDIVPNPDAATETAPFEIHFIDVGQADCALVICDDEYMLIDGGNKDDSSTVYTYLKKYNVTELDYIVATHAHEDHVGGLSGALNFAKAKVALSPVTEYDSKAFSDFVKNLEDQDVKITIPNVGDSFDLGSAEFNILACNTTDDTNNTSIVLKITYGETSFLFTGDAEYECEKIMLDNEADISSTVLKVGHHGSSTSSSYRFLREVSPQYAVISVGKDNEYGHPHDEVMSRLSDADITVYRTDIYGDIICTSDGKNVSFRLGTQKASDTDADKRDMVLNTSSMKYHELGCASIEKTSDKNRKEFHGTTDEVEAMGYTPCGNCHES